MTKFSEEKFREDNIEEKPALEPRKIKMSIFIIIHSYK